MAKEYRIVVMGAGGVGKSALTVRFVQRIFVETYDPTIEDSHRIQTEIDGTSCVLEILDTAGSSQFTAMRDLYMRMGQGFVLVFSITDSDTLQTCIDIHDRIAKVRDSPRFCAVLVGNKTDLEAERKVATAHALQTATEWGNHYVEVSVKNDLNVRAPFESVVRAINAAQPPARRKVCVVL